MERSPPANAALKKLIQQKNAAKKTDLEVDNTEEKKKEPVKVQEAEEDDFDIG